MISKNQIKYISSLKQKKFRDELGKFVVEGDKLVDELINSDFDIDIVFATNDWVSKCDCPKLISKTDNIIAKARKLYVLEIFNVCQKYVTFTAKLRIIY